MNWRALRIAVVGPLPPPAGGMAGQTAQLVELLQREGAAVTLVQTNTPYWPRALASIRGVRALPRLLGYVRRLWHAAGSVQIIHVMANSGWSWHLFAAPAIWIGRVRHCPVVVNYRGGEALAFLQRSQRWVRPSLRAASALAVPSGFLDEIFGRFGFTARVVPNIVDLERFRPVAGEPGMREPMVLVARNLEPIYDVRTALRAFADVRASIPQARLVVAGSGAERQALEALARDLGLAGAVEFTGQLDRHQIAERFRAAAVMVNPSRVDNMPNSVLEAMASGVPVVSTNVGGVPHIVAHERTALLVPPGDSAAMSEAILRLLQDRPMADSLVRAGLAEAQRYTWPRVREDLGAVYAGVLRVAGPTSGGA